MPVPVPVPAGYDLTNPDIFRSPNPHVGFRGGGVHFCPGSHLAKLEIDLMFNSKRQDRLVVCGQLGDGRERPTSAVITHGRHQPGGLGHDSVR